MAHEHASTTNAAGPVQRLLCFLLLRLIMQRQRIMSGMPQIYRGLGTEVMHPLDEAQHLSPLFVSSTMVKLSSEHGSTRLPY
jgi:hypothetical protein